MQKYKIKEVAAFTLAEVLITLVIIGVVAALTIPSIVVSYQKKMYVTQLKKSYNYLTNGFKTMMARDGVTQLTDTTFWAKMPDGTLTDSALLTSAGKGAKDEFLKVFNTIKIYDSTTIPDYEKIEYKGLNCTSCTAAPITNQIYLSDGANIHIGLKKNPTVALCGSVACKSLKEFQEYKHTPTKLWRKLGYVEIDVNGVKGPNLWGRDIYIFELGDDGGLYPRYGIEHAMAGNCASLDTLNSCSIYWNGNASETRNCSTTSNSQGIGCAARIIEENWQMKY